MRRFSERGLQPRMVWVGYDDVNGVTATQRCRDKTEIEMPQFSLQLGVEKNEVWVRQHDETPVPLPFWLLLSCDSEKGAERVLQAKDSAVKIVPRSNAAATSSPETPWRFVSG